MDYLSNKETILPVFPVMYRQVSSMDYHQICCSDKNAGKSFVVPWNQFINLDKGDQ